MPGWGDLNLTGGPAQQAPAPTQGGPAPTQSGWGSLDLSAGPAAPAPAVRETTDKGSGMAAGLAGAGLLGGGLALAAKHRGAVGAIGKGLLALRSQLMLSGLAPLKSAMGNVGGAGVASIERGSMKPLKETLSMQTLKDAVAAYKRGTPTANDANQVTLKNPFTGKELPSPGRFMGALDEATQGALRRAGLSADDAAREVLQTPLGKNWGRAGEALDNPVMGYLVPFRRTPLNQLWEGGRAIGRALGSVKGDTPEQIAQARRALTVYGGVGATHGALTADDDKPLSIPMAVAASGRYGMPYAIAALMARGVFGGEDGGDIASTMTPISEFGIEQGLMSPGKPFGFDEDGFDPSNLAAIRALERLTQ